MVSVTLGTPLLFDLGNKQGCGRPQNHLFAHYAGKYQKMMGELDILVIKICNQKVLSMRAKIVTYLESKLCL